MASIVTNSAYGIINDAMHDANLSGKALAEWKGQRYLQEYLATIAAVDEGVGKILDYLDEAEKKWGEKYAVIWLFLGAGTVVLSGFPQILQWVSQQLGVIVPANLIFSMVLLLLVGVTLHLTWELSTAEDEARALAEESAILRNSVERLTADVQDLKVAVAPSKGPDTSGG